MNLTMNSAEIDQLIRALIRAQAASRSALVQRKIDRALADVKRAKTLLKKAAGTLDWAEHYQPPK